MIKLSQPIIVEGKYDKIALENVIDALIIPTNGFGIFKDKEKCQLIRLLAQKFGVIIATDSDSAGNLIRAHIKKIVGDCEIINVYVPQIKGKEKRKTASSAEGFLGVEGIDRQTLERAFLKSGVTGGKRIEKIEKITKTDLFMSGLSGGENSLLKRQDFLKFVELPTNLSPNAMLDILNTVMTKEEFSEVAKEWHAARDKS